MGNKPVVNQILPYIPSINWSVSKDNEVVSLFETTIRYLGGLLSAYDLLSGPLASLATQKNKKTIPILLQQATNLANNLSYAFDTPTGIPHNGLFFADRSTDKSSTNGLATIGTLVMEWTRLSDLTGNSTYGALAQKGESYLLKPQPASSQPWPGLVGTVVNLNTGLFQDANGGWNGGDDSFYEYLIKMYVYDSSRFSSYKDRWVKAADSTIKHLASHPDPRPDLTFLAQFQGKTLNRKSGHLACFDGGNFILGGLVLKQQKYIDFGLQLVNSCEDTYNQTLTKIGPEGFAWDAGSVPSGQADFYKRAGFYITSGAYVLRPEVIESFYYAYRATGNTVYQDVRLPPSPFPLTIILTHICLQFAWNAFKAINATCRTGSGFSEISNVNAANGGSFFNFQDSFFFAEVLKYSYLIHAPDAVYQVNDGGVNQYVFNTEAHPMKVFGTPV